MDRCIYIYIYIYIYVHIYIYMHKSYIKYERHQRYRVVTYSDSLRTLRNESAPRATMTTGGQPFCALQADDEIQEVACTNITVLDSLVHVARKRHVITKSPIHAENDHAPAPILAETNFDCSLHDR